MAVWFGLPTNPAEAWFLSEEQKQMMRIRQEQTAQYIGSDEFKWIEFRIAVQDPKLYLSAAIQFCQDILLYGFSTFVCTPLDMTLDKPQSPVSECVGYVSITNEINSYLPFSKQPDIAACRAIT